MFAVSPAIQETFYFCLQCGLEPLEICSDDDYDDADDEKDGSDDDEGTDEPSW